MTQRLRPLAITVDEPSAGAYRWRIVERVADSEEWSELQAAPKNFKTYSKAMAAGLLQLQSLISDLDEGPRDQAPAGGSTMNKSADTEKGSETAGEPQAPRGKFFGFGSA
ncbi:hypothetical protein BH11PSE13_BH11PSE13_20860 [soil metagenome]